MTNSYMPSRPIYPPLSPEKLDLMNEIKARKETLFLEIQEIENEIAEIASEMESLDVLEDGNINPSSKNIAIARKKFNMDPKKGIKLMMEHNLLPPVNGGEDISLSVAHFLFQGEGLNKTSIGEYLGELEEFNLKVLEHFISLHQFCDMIIVQALRQFLWSFRLPGESQKIDRIMQGFAQRYCECNPNIFKSIDTCYVLSYSIIMLNTILHNPSVRHKPSVESFISMNRDSIDAGENLQDSLLISLYNCIKKEPFKIPEDDGNDLYCTFFNPDKEGWLWKQGGRYKNWKRRWFILTDRCLYYFEYTTDKEPRGIIPLENVDVRSVPESAGTGPRNSHIFEIFSLDTDVIKACKTNSEGKMIEGKHMVYRMSASTSEEKEEWIQCIRKEMNPHFGTFFMRKRKQLFKNSSIK